MPPRIMRALVGRPDEEAFDAPDRIEPLAGLPPTSRVFDFGCGCGRTARHLLRQTPRPAAYLGVDLHRGMVRWCQKHLSPLDPAFRFEHHDVGNPGFNPGRRKPAKLPLPAEWGTFDLVYAASVFTHLRESQVPHYLQECARILAPGGVIRASWFLFDKAPFPMMQRFQNALYINEHDPTNAVIFDRTWLLDLLNQLGLAATGVAPPSIRGFQWSLDIQHAGAGTPILLPPDAAPRGSLPSPVVTVAPHSVGAARASLSRRIFMRPQRDR